MPAGPHAGNRNRPAYSGQQRFRFPKQIIQLFAPRKPIDFKPPPRVRKLRPMIGLASFVSKFEFNKTDEMQDSPSKEKEKSETKFETPAQRRTRVRAAKNNVVSKIVKERGKEWDPRRPANVHDMKKTEDAFKTLFVYNIAYTTVEQRIHDELEAFGPVKSVVMPKDLKGMPRGYAFVEFERERDLKIAYREANGMRIDGRRVLVDVERGRTVKDWRPNRLNGTNNSCTKKRRPDKRDGRQPP